MSDTILLIDDDIIIRTVVHKMLENAGYRVVQAADGTEGLSLARSAEPDLILLDVMMPGMDGYEVCARLLRDPTTADVPVVFLSGLSEDQDRARAFSAGAVGYLVKPVKAKTLLEGVREWLTTRDQWHALKSDASSLPAESTAYDSLGAFRDFVKGPVAELEEKIDETCRAALHPQRFYHQLDALDVRATRVASALAEFLKVDYIEEIDADVVKFGLLPTSFCVNNLVVPIVDDEHVVLVMSDPFDLTLLDALSRGLGAKWREEYGIAITPPAAIYKLVRVSDGSRGQSRTESMNELTETIQEAFAPADKPVAEPKKGTPVEEEDAPIIRLVDRLILQAREESATDIHIEPTENGVAVRLRIDGKLNENSHFDSKSASRALVNRVKIMSGLDIAERRLPQDGRITYRGKKGEADLDLRVAVSPTRYGEMVVMRLLDQERSTATLEELGMSRSNAEIYRRGLEHSHGMILHVGPTGSGKSATLYSALGEINSPDIKILTAEDPIEYTLAGVHQVQMRPEIGLDFARALRSFLRLDPDVILVGEIRDLETARIAVEASLTGHLLFATLHANDAASTVLRLCEIGLDGVVVASALRMVCSQRLLRRLCTSCRAPRQPTARERLLMGMSEEHEGTIYRAVGCGQCRDTGYRGRIGIHEILVLNDTLVESIREGGHSTQEIERVAVAGGMRTIFQDAMEKVMDGISSLEDALLVVSPDETPAQTDRPQLRSAVTAA